MVEGDLYDAATVRGQFDRMSRSYERMNIVMSFGFSVRWRRQMMRLLPISTPRRQVLDAMSEMAETWSEVLRSVPDAEPTAVDFSARMIEHGAMRNRDRFGGRFTLVCEDTLRSDLPACGFDVVVSAHGLKTFDEEQSRRFAEELVRVLRPGGTFSFVEVTDPANRVLRGLYDFYLSRVLPVVGALLISDPVEYQMLHRYLRAYGDGWRTSDALAAHPVLRPGCDRSSSAARRAGPACGFRSQRGARKASATSRKQGGETSREG